MEHLQQVEQVVRIKYLIKNAKAERPTAKLQSCALDKTSLVQDIRYLPMAPGELRSDSTILGMHGANVPVKNTIQNCEKQIS